VIDNLKSRFEYVLKQTSIRRTSVATHEVVNNESFSIGGKKIIPINAMHGNLQVLGIELMILLIDRCKTIEKPKINKLKTYWL
jgi:phosphoribosyl 1,2-cyclic phosphate phosphodiesterase